MARCPLRGRVSGRLAEVLGGALESARAPVTSTAGERVEPGALLTAATQVAGVLRSRDVRPDEPVLVVIGNRPADLGALLGVWLAGAVAVPAHVSAASATLCALRDATAARFLIDRQEVRALASERPPERPLLRGAALVIFTSGSTGRPKGVVIGHERFAGKLDVLGRLLRFGPDDAVVVPLQLTFIFGLWVSLLALDAGATLILMPKFSAETAARSLDAGGTVLAAVPTMLRALLSGPPIAAPALRTILTGGEALAPALAGALGQAFPNAGLWDLYGLTETGSCDFCLAPGDQPAGIGSLGLP